jgi:ligand-binding SRPBCC domain-containing protein
MPRYLIIRTFDVTSDQMPVVGRRSREAVEQQFPQITWEHSHVVVDDDGTVRTYCVYEAPHEEMVRQHGKMLGQHTIDGLHEIAGDVTPADFPPPV